VQGVNLTRLRMLSEVGARGSLSAAASALDYTPSAVSQQIALLEREAGVRLVERGPRGASLTDAGELLARHADAALLELAKARRALDALSAAPAARLRVAAFPTALATVVALAARTFADAHPETALELVDAEPHDALAALEHRAADVAVLYDYEPAGSTGDVVWHEPVLLCLPAGHRLSEHDEIELAELAGEAWFGAPDRPWAPALLEQCRAAGFTPAFSPLRSSDYAAMQGLASAHGLVGLIPALALAAPHPGVAIRRLRPEPRARRLRFAAADRASPAAACFRDHLAVAAQRSAYGSAGSSGSASSGTMSGSSAGSDEMTPSISPCATGSSASPSADSDAGWPTGASAGASLSTTSATAETSSPGRRFITLTP
jgi:DNA-binding transcriptional LysR family regulator